MAIPNNQQQAIPTPSENLVIEPEKSAADDLGDFMMKAKQEADAEKGVTSAHPVANAQQNEQVLANAQTAQQTAFAEPGSEFDDLINGILQDVDEKKEEQPQQQQPTAPTPQTIEQPTQETKDESVDIEEKQDDPVTDTKELSEETKDENSDKDAVKPVDRESLDKETKKIIKELEEEYTSKIGEKNLKIATLEEDTRLWKQRYEIAAKANKEYLEQADNAEFQMNNMGNVPVAIKETAYYYKKFEENPNDLPSQRDLLVSTSRLLRSVTNNKVNIDNLLRNYLAQWWGSQQPVGSQVGGGWFNQMINPNSPKPTRLDAQSKRNQGFVHQEADDIIF